VLFQMVWMLLAAIVLLLAVVYLFYKVIKALILQKEIAEMKTDLANNLSHELKTPLTSIALVTKSLKMPEVFNSPEKRKDLIGILERQNNRIQHLIDHIMETTVLNVPQKESVEIEKLLNTIVNDFPAENHKLALIVENKNISIQTDPHLLEWAIENLLKNAQKFSPSGSQIVLKRKQANNGYDIEVIDEGLGISENNQSKIFEKFYRVPKGLVHNTKGL
jgi:two-component system phosphate regulon sensor histidine kinase PhoR